MNMATWSVFHVNLLLFVTLLAISFIFRFESLTTNVMFRWNSNITLFSLTPVDYRGQLFTSGYRQFAFGLWSFQMLVTIFIVIYHLAVPHHPKFYITIKNKVAIIAHMIGGTVAILGFYIGVLSNKKEVCLVAVLSGLFLHWPSTLWQLRQLHGQRELMVPSYVCMAWLLLQCYVDFFLYDGSFQTVFSCAMCMNVFSMVRVFGLLSNLGGLSPSVDRSTLLAGIGNGPFIIGPLGVFLFCAAIILWNVYFRALKPIPRCMLRIDRGYNDTVPDEFEAKRGVSFSKKLEEMSKKCEDRKEAVARALFKVLAGDDDVIDVSEVTDLYRAWGVADADSAAKATFKKVDKDGSGEIDLDEFKRGFENVIKGIFLKGEYETTQNTSQLLNIMDKRQENGVPVNMTSTVMGNKYLDTEFHLS